MKNTSNLSNVNFQDLMQYRIHEILLIASPYDAFILEQDGKLTEQILSEYIGLNLSYAPRVWNASTANSAFKMLDNRSYDLIIIMMRISDMNPITLGKKLRKTYPKKPLVLFAFDESEIKRINTIQKNIFDDIFVWSGNANIFPAMIKAIEDKKNISKDIKTADVRLIIFIEDTPKYYSAILPTLYREIIYHTKQLIDKSLNDTQKLLHMRGRPKILLATNFEEAIKLFNKYQLNIFGIISDLKFPINNKINKNAGIKICKYIRKKDKSIPILIQSTETVPKIDIKKYSINYINKNSPKLFKNLRQFMISNFGFGNFEFRLPNGKTIGNASDIKTLVKQLRKIPKESLKFHVSNNHLSNWLAARGEFVLASKFRAISSKDFRSLEERRKYHIKLLEDSSHSINTSIIAEYSESIIDLNSDFIRIGHGSLGGKARGLAFATSKMINNKFKTKFPNINFKIPKVIVISTSEFDEFMEKNELWDLSVSSYNNKYIEKKFIDSKLTKNLKRTLKTILKSLPFPLAIRSSGLLEDSQYKPLAGMYSTYMLPNSNTNFSERFNQLCESIKRIYASTFFKEPKSLMDSVSHRYEEEKMAIIIMEMIGKEHGEYFYPTISGVFQSYNYYPVSYMNREDGVGFLALGLGRTIAEGGKSLRFCPKYPNILPQFYSIKSSINSSQNNFFALNMAKNQNQIKSGEQKNLKLLNLNVAEKDGELKHIASVVSSDDNIIRDSLNYKGIRILNFSSILKYDKFPLSDILKKLSFEGQKLIGSPIEIEFAININDNQDNEFSLLQIKPMPIDNIHNQLDIYKLKDTDLSLCHSDQVLGDGSSNNIQHIIYINPKKFKRDSTQLIANEIGKYNKKLGKKNPFLLVGPGRWGSLDPWLGIPVDWEQIANARAIIEIGIDSFSPDPSFGSHFFQNLTSLRIGYFTLDKKSYKINIDWDWLKKQKHIYQSDLINVIKLKEPLLIKLDGVKGQGIILKSNTKSDKRMNEEEASGI